MSEIQTTGRPDGDSASAQQDASVPPHEEAAAPPPSVRTGDGSQPAVSRGGRPRALWAAMLLAAAVLVMVAVVGRSRVVASGDAAIVAGDMNRLRWALRLGADPDKKGADGLSLTERAVARQSVDSVGVLLQSGVDPSTVLNCALEELYLKVPTDYQDPGVAIIRMSMEAYRRRSFQPVEAEGVIEVAMEMSLGGSGISMVPRMTILLAGETLPLRLSGLETEYVALLVTPPEDPTRRRGGYAVAPQGRCRITGWRTEQGVEATRVVSMEPGGRGISIPVAGWLPSTAKEFRSRTGLGRVLGELERKR
jgi:hypothetical protein